jgi:uncharacterized protein GlcG (DUF336 family)
MKGARLRFFSACVAVILASVNVWGATQLTYDDVELILAQAASRAAQIDPHAIIAVVDREGYVLGVWNMEKNPAPNPEFVSGAVARAGTAAFLSSNQNAFTSRTAGFIIQQHFPPLVRDTSNGPLVGVGISSVFLGTDRFVQGRKHPNAIFVDQEGHSDVNFMKQIPLDQTGTFDPNEAVFDNINPFSPSAVFPALTGRKSPGIFGAAIYTGTNTSFFVPATMTMSASAAAAQVAATGNSTTGYIVSGTAGPLIGAVGTSLNDAPGGVPLYKNGELVGGVGVAGGGSPIKVSTGFAIIQSIFPVAKINALTESLGLGPIAPLGLEKNQLNATPGFTEGPDIDEDVALSGQTGYGPSSEILATNDFIGGIQLPYVETSTNLPRILPLGSVGVAVDNFPAQKSPPEFAYPKAEFGGVSGEIRFPIRSDPMPGNIGNTRRLSAGEVGDIIANAAKRSGITRAGIRLPVGVPAEVFISVVGNPGDSGQPPPILGVFRTGEATIFSWDVAVQKARTAFFFSNNDFAESTRTVGFLAQRWYPPGIDGQPPGPFFGVQEALLTDGFLGFLDPLRYHSNPYLPNQITIFPGGFPLYRGSVLIGAIGVSGDGVDQDDIISSSGCDNFLAPNNIRADQFFYRGARLPYAKFPRDPSL